MPTAVCPNLACGPKCTDISLLSRILSTPGVNEVDYSLYPSRETQLRWLNYYLQAHKQLCKEGWGGTAVTPREVEKLYVQVNKFALASHLLWAFWALIQNQFSTIDFDFLRYAVIRFNQYFKVKPQVSALEMPK
uniref:ethanolamine kinase n=1 Tax=Vombatus ursinus TaxID=29139 RepID=A0A4X2L6U7_VOMUR